MSVLPAGPPHQDPLGPERILRALPARERDGFLAAYRAAVTGSQDVAGYANLQRALRAWLGLALAASRPGFYEAQALALAPAAGCCWRMRRGRTVLAGEVWPWLAGVCCADARPARRGA
jgi:hypothetical protein